MTDAEKKLWRHLKRIPLGTSHFRRQAMVGPFYADFASHEHRLIIEVDGGQHGQVDVIASDAQRTRFFEANGYRVPRFWNSGVLSNIDGVLTAIADALAAPPPPTPPHRCAGGGGGAHI